MESVPFLGYNVPIPDREDNNMSFGQNLQFLRKLRNKMTQEELAEKLGVSRQTVSRWGLDAACPDPMAAPFRLIPNADKVLTTHMQVNGIRHPKDAGVIPCFEKEYDRDGIHYMDVYIAAE